MTERTFTPEQFPAVGAAAAAVIRAGDSQSAAIACGGLRPLALQMPEGWTDAVVTFEGSLDGAAWSPVWKDGAEYSVTVAAGKWIVLPAADMAGLAHLRIRSGTEATPVAQVEERSIGVALGKVLA